MGAAYYVSRESPRWGGAAATRGVEAELEMGKRVTDRCGGWVAGVFFRLLLPRHFHSASAWGSPSVCGAFWVRSVALFHVYSAVASLWPGAGKLTTHSGRAEGAVQAPHLRFLGAAAKLQAIS